MRRVGLVPVPVCACGAALALTGCSAVAARGTRRPRVPHPRPRAVGGSTGEASTAPTGHAAPGSGLRIGDTATVAWRRRPTGELGVLESVEPCREGRPADFDGLAADGAGRGARSYYVDVTVANAGTVRPRRAQTVPLYLRDDSDTLGAPWGFGGGVPACQQPAAARRRSPPGDRGRCAWSTSRRDRGRVRRDWSSSRHRGLGPITWTGDGRGRPGSGRAPLPTPALTPRFDNGGHERRRPPTLGASGGSAARRHPGRARADGRASPTPPTAACAPSRGRDSTSAR